MKNDRIVPQLPDPPKLPDTPLHQEDLSMPCPMLTQAEIVALTNASNIFQIARADYEMKRAAVTLKLFLLWKP